MSIPYAEIGASMINNGQLLSGDFRFFFGLDCVQHIVSRGYFILMNYHITAIFHCITN